MKELEPAPFKCGHARTWLNTILKGPSATACCRTCHNAVSNRAYHRMKAKKAQESGRAEERTRGGT